MQQGKQFYTICELALLLGTTVSAVQAHLARKNFDAVPPPIHLGKRLAWPVRGVTEWIEQKMAQVTFYSSQPVALKKDIHALKRKRGRPRKTENKITLGQVE